MDKNYRLRFFSPREVVLILMDAHDQAPECSYIDARGLRLSREGTFGATLERHLLNAGYPIRAIAEACASVITDAEIKATRS